MVVSYHLGSKIGTQVLLTTEPSLQIAHFLLRQGLSLKWGWWRAIEAVSKNKMLGFKVCATKPGLLLF